MVIFQLAIKISPVATFALNASMVLLFSVQPEFNKTTEFHLNFKSPHTDTVLAVTLASQQRVVISNFSSMKHVA